MSRPTASPDRARGPWRHWRLAVLIGLLLRVGAVLATPVFPTIANTWDTNFYHETAGSLASGEGYRFQGKPTAFFPPGYPAALSLVYRAAGAAPRAGQFAGIAASLWLLAAAAWLARGLSGKEAARRMAFVLALDPSQIVMPAFLMSEVFCGAALATALAAAVWQGRKRTLLWLGVAAGFGVLGGMIRGHAFLVLPAAVAALGGWRRWNRRRVLTALAVILLLDVAVVGAWSERNRELLGQRVLVATNAGINLLLGNNPNAFGARADPPGGVPQTGDEILDERIATDLALEYMRQNPGRVLLSLPVKAARLWVPAPALTYRVELGEKWGRVPAWVVLILAQAAHAAALVLAAARAWRAARERVAGDDRARWRLGLAVLGIWTLGHLPFLGGARYFFPVQAVLWLLALGGGSSRERNEPDPA